MSTTTEALQVVISADVSGMKANCETAKNAITGMSDKGNKAVNGMGDTFKKVGATIAAAVSIKAIKDFGSACVEAYQDSVQQQAKLTEVMKTRIGANDEQIQSVLDLADAQQKLGVVEGDTTVAGAQQLATFATSSDTIKSLIPAMQNLAVQQNGVNVTSENMTSIANLMGKALQGQTGALTKVGISFDETQEKVLKYGTEEERAAMLAQVITDNVGNMNEALAQTDEGKIAQMNNILGDVKETLGSAISPIITAIAGSVNDFVTANQPKIDSFVQDTLPKIQQGFSKGYEAVSKVFNFVRDNMPLIAALGIAIGVVTTAIGLQTAAQGVKAAMNATETASIGALIAAKYASATATLAALAPYVAIVAAIAAVIAIIVVCVKHWDEIKAKVTEVWNSIKEKTQAAVDKVTTSFNNFKDNVSNKVEALKTAITDKFNVIKEKMLAPVEKARDLIKAAIDKIKSFFKFEWSFPKLKLPHFSLNGKFSLSPPSVPHLAVNWYAKGGVFDNPTLFSSGNGLSGLGENGAEAVVPLENNTEWLDRLATMLASKIGTGGDIVLKVDETTLGKVTCKSINTYSRQTGSLPINLI